MKKIKHKFVYILISLLLIFISAIFGYMHFFNTVDRNAYFTLVEWTGTINNTVLALDVQKQLQEKDIIQTGKKSFWIIEWGDGSVTRMGENTKIQVEKSFVSQDRTVIQVMFQIFSGKTWSNVLSYVPNESYFRQVFEDTEVAVRGTVFTMDIDKNYLYVDNHTVTVKSKDKNIFIKENQAMEISTKKFISLQDFIRYFEDIEFFKMNKNLDEQLYLFIKKELEENFQNIQKNIQFLTEKIQNNKDVKNISRLLWEYQKLHFLESKTNPDLFKEKIKAKETLISATSGKSQEALIKSYFVDFVDTMKGKNTSQLSEMMQFMGKNMDLFSQDFLKEYVSTIDIHSALDKKVREELQIIKENLGLGIDIWGEFIDHIDMLTKERREALYKLKNDMEKGIIHDVKWMQKQLDGIISDIQFQSKNAYNDVQYRVNQKLDEWLGILQEKKSQLEDALRKQLRP